MPVAKTARPTARPKPPHIHRPLPARPAAPKPAPAPEPAPELPAEADARSPRAPFAVCSRCYPDGWPAGATGLGCEHGIWSRPWVI